MDNGFCCGNGKMLTYREESRSRGLSVCYSNRQICAPGHSFGPGVRDHYIIHYVLRGKGSFEQDGKRYDLAQGDGFLMTPYHPAAYRADDADPWEYTWIAFRGEDADGILARCGLSVQSPVFHYRREEPLEAHFPTDYSASAVSEPGNFAALGALYSLFALLMRNREALHEVVQKGNSLQQAIACVEANYFNPLTVERLAAQVGLSRSQLYRVFKSALGMSPQAYILQYRLTKARYLVCHTALSVAEIALSCGFEDQSYFTRCFRQRYGAAPLVYRAGDEARPVG